MRKSLQKMMVRVVRAVVAVTLSLVLLPVAINVGTSDGAPAWFAPLTPWLWPLVGVGVLLLVTLEVQARAGKQQAPALGVTVPSTPLEIVLPDDVGGLSDEQWWRQVQHTYDRQWREHAGSPESFAEAAKRCYGHGDFGQALLFSAKAVDLLHTLYGDLTRRQPSAADAWILDGFVSAAGAAHTMHPQARIDAPLRQTVHRLQSIATTCRRIGVPDALYSAALASTKNDNPDVRYDDLRWE